MITDNWDQMPNLNKRRHDHGSCSQGNSVYVFCGGSKLDDIEILNLKKLKSGWKHHAIRGLECKIFMGAISIKKDIVYLFGGEIYKEKKYHRCKEIIEVNVKSKKAQKIVSVPDEFTLSPIRHDCTQISN